MKGDGGDTLSLSRLDVVSCALGAAIILGLVLSVKREIPPVQVPSETVVVVVWQVDSLPDGERPLANLRLQLPSGEAVDLPLDDFTSHGVLRAAPKTKAGRLLAASAAEVVVGGISYFGDSAHATSSADPSYSLYLLDPVPGDWHVMMRRFNQVAAESGEIAFDALGSKATASIELHLPDGTIVEQPDLALGFGRPEPCFSFLLDGE